MVMRAKSLQWWQYLFLSLHYIPIHFDLCLTISHDASGPPQRSSILDPGLKKTLIERVGKEKDELGANIGKLFKHRPRIQPDSDRCPSDDLIRFLTSGFDWRIETQTSKPLWRTPQITSHHAFPRATPCEISPMAWTTIATLCKQTAWQEMSLRPP